MAQEKAFLQKRDALPAPEVHHRALLHLYPLVQRHDDVELLLLHLLPPGQPRRGERRPRVQRA